MLPARVNSQSGLQKELVDWWATRTHPWHTPSLDPTVFLLLSVRYGQLPTPQGSNQRLVMVPRLAAPPSPRQHTHCCAGEPGCSLAGQSLKQCWGLFVCILCSLSSRTQETALSFLLCASWTSLTFRAVLVTIKLIIIPSSLTRSRALPAVPRLIPGCRLNQSLTKVGQQTMPGLKKQLWLLIIIFFECDTCKGKSLTDLDGNDNSLKLGSSANSLQKRCSDEREYQSRGFRIKKTTTKLKVCKESFEMNLDTPLMF